MGLSFLNQLIEEKTHNIFMINRGNKYWNYQAKELEGVTWYFGDREEYYEFKKLVIYISQKHGITSDNKWDLVMDFSGFDRKEVKCAMRALNEICKFYLFVSSDSIYDVCDNKIRRDDFIKEIHAIRPESLKLVKELNHEDQYANDKLRCEEYLLSHSHEIKFKYLCLRLPDVFGPYDRSGRFWAYILWIKSSKKYPIHINKFTDLRLMSFAYSLDVVKFFFYILNKIQ